MLIWSCVQVSCQSNVVAVSGLHIGGGLEKHMRLLKVLLQPDISISKDVAIDCEDSRHPAAYFHILLPVLPAMNRGMNSIRMQSSVWLSRDGMEMRHLSRPGAAWRSPPIPPLGEAAASRDPKLIGVRHSQSTFMGAYSMALDLLIEMARSTRISAGAWLCSPWK